MQLDLARIEYGDADNGHRMAIVSFVVQDDPIPKFTIDVPIMAGGGPDEVVAAARLKLQVLALHLAEAAAS